MDTSILGIDVASRKLDLCWSNTDQKHYATIAYSAQALDQFLVANPMVTSGEYVVGVESTGDYHLAVTKYFLRRGFTVKILNPILTKQYTRATIRGTKTDKTDSEVICKLIEQGEGDVASLSALLDRNKELLRLARTITTAASQLTLRLQSTQRKDVGDTTQIEDEIQEIITNLKNLSGNLVTEATRQPSKTEQLIDSIPGFATHLAAIVHHELGDVSRFKNAKSLVAFAGLDPRIKQSGQRLNTNGRIMKRGSTHLRYALFLAANIAKRCDSELGAYYNKKKSEGRRHKEILCIISRKLLYRIWAVVKDQREYVIR